MSSPATNNQEARNDTHGDDAMTRELQVHVRGLLNVETTTS